ncbi:MAG: phage portal protein [Actinomyces sp.]|nr:MAG: phage portal protein [Actinomyces sp.]
MSLLRPRAGAGERRAVDLSAWITGDESWQPTASGERVSFEAAVGLSAVSRAVSLLADLASTLPVDVFRRVPNARPVPVDPPPQLVANPSSVVSQRVWRAQLMVSWLLWGNAYGLVLTRDAAGWPTTVEWLDPTTVRVVETSTLKPPVFEVSGRRVGPDELLHLPGKHVRPGSSVGLAPLERHKETFGLALAARNFGARWFGDGAHPSAVLSTDQVINEEQASAMKRRFMAAMKRKREPAVLGAGVSYTPIQVPANESQFLETQEAVVNDIARAFDLPVEVLGGSARGSSVTYANREQRSLDLLAFSVDPWLVLLEEAWTSNLPRPQFVRVNRSALLRTDATARVKVHESALRAGWRTVNEVRALEDLPPVPDGDRTLWPPFAATVDQTDQAPAAQESQP